MAADVGGLTIDGYVDAILEFSDSSSDTIDDAEIDFSAFAQLEVGYAIGDAVNANIELGFDEGGSVDLEQAFVEWAVAEQVTITMGKFHNWIGWEGRDAPELYRINNSILYGMGQWPGGGEGMFWGANNGNVTGLGVGFNASEQFSVSLYIVDEIFTSMAPATRSTEAFSIGVAGDFALEGIGTFGAAISLGQEEGPAGGGIGDNEDILDINIVAEIDALKEDNGLLFAADIHFFDFDTSDGLAVMLMGNYAFGTDTPMSASLFISHVEPNSDFDDDEIMEIAVALLTNPTNDENFSLNFEVRSISRDDVVSTDSEFGVFVEALAVIP
jgi:hypothetical protein